MSDDASTGLAPVRVWLVLGVVLVLGLVLKLPCASGTWSDGRPYTRFCYTDIVPLFAGEGLDRHRLPYVQHPNEYPVGTGLVMWAASLPARSEGTFFVVNALLLSAAAAATTMLLRRMVGGRALFFAAAPTLVLNAFLNWDLVPVLLMTAGVAAFLRNRDAPAGGLLGAGAATKVFPGLVAVPLLLDRLRARRPGSATSLAVAAVAVALATNLPFMILGWHNWTLFFRYNARRVMDWATPWFLGCHTLTGRLDCGRPSLFGALSVVTFLAASLLVWRLATSRAADLPAWTFGFPVLVLFLLTAKVYSPQYSLWLLPWFALVLPDVRLFVAFELTDVAVSLAEFSWLGRQAGFGGLTVGWLELAVAARIVLMLACVVAYVRRAPSLASTAEQAGSGYAQMRMPVQ